MLIRDPRAHVQPGNHLYGLFPLPAPKVSQLVVAATKPKNLDTVLPCALVTIVCDQNPKQSKSSRLAVRFELLVVGACGSGFAQSKWRSISRFAGTKHKKKPIKIKKKQQTENIHSHGVPTSAFKSRHSGSEAGRGNLDPW